MQYVLRFGPLVAAFALGLAAVIEPFVPGYTGIVTKVLEMLGVVKVEADVDVVQAINSVIVGVVALVGVSRKGYSIVMKKYFFHPRVQ